MNLTEDHVERFIGAAKDFNEADIEVDDIGDGGVPSQAEVAEKIGNNPEAMRILNKHGFSPEEFSGVSMNVIMAMGAAEMAANKAEIDQAMAQFEAMKGQIPEAQYNQMVGSILAAQEMFAKAPPGNIELVARYKGELEALGD